MGRYIDLISVYTMHDICIYCILMRTSNRILDTADIAGDLDHSATFPTLPTIAYAIPAGLFVHELDEYQWLQN